MRKIFFVCLFFLINQFLNAQLAAGDIAFVGYNTDSGPGGSQDHSFSFITLKDISASEVVYFTEEGWNDDTNSWAGTSEGHLKWTAPPSGISCGTIIFITESGADVFTITGGGTITLESGSGWNLSSGDQVLAYQAATVEPASTPTFITGINGDDGNGSPVSIDPVTKWNDPSTGPLGTSKSGLPFGLTNGVNCLSLFITAFTEEDNAKYTGTLTGTSTALRASINDRTNWSFNNSIAFDISPGSYSPSVTCVAPATEPTVTTTAPSSIANTSVTLAGNVTADGGATVTGRGIVYSITTENANPEIGGGSVIQDTNGSGTGIFSESITGLAAGTHYSFKSYAINSEGTNYGALATFTTTGKGWTGASNTDWATASNWNPTSIPIASDNLVIPNVGNKPIIGSSTGAIANNITIDASSSVTIESGGSLIIDGTAIVNGDFIYKVNVSDTNWHLVSSPVSGEQFNDTWNTANGINTNLPNEAVSNYINTSDADGDWVYFQHNVTPATTFGSGIGYSLQRTGAGDYTFIGTFPSPPINPTITANDIGGANENRWTLIGNPFPAHINIATFLAANATPLTDTHESVYVWNATTSTYDDLTVGFIHPGQGFFVSSNVPSTSVTFTKAMQSDENGITFYRNTNPKIKIIVTNGNQEKTTEINYLSGKTAGLDPRFDIGTFTGQSSNFNVFTHLVSDNDGVSFKRQALPDNNYENIVIPLGITSQVNVELIFSLITDNFPSDLKIFLEDRLLNTFTRLDETNTNYKVTPTEALNGVGRFYLHTSANALSIKNISIENIGIYKIGNATLKIIGLQNSKTSIKLFNTIGKQVFNTSFTSNGIKNISLPKLAKGIYIVQLQTDKGKLNKKIILE